MQAPRRALLLLGLLCGRLRAATPAASADELKAVYLHKFLGYIEWPADALGPALVAAVAGADGVFDAMQRAAAGRPVQGRAVSVRRATRPDATGLNLVFVGREAWSDLPAWVAQSRGRGLVVVTDSPHGTRSGATLTFVQGDDRVRFEASLNAAEAAGVRVSSRLLAVAERVSGAAP